MRVKNGRSSGAIRRSTRRADSSRSVRCARVIVKAPSWRAIIEPFAEWGWVGATAYEAEKVSRGLSGIVARGCNRGELGEYSLGYSPLRSGYTRAGGGIVWRPGSAP